ncbi:Probable toxin YpjF [Yersinia intermedia]|uniref:TA system toxin CbtA family protein n=1 Tax=Yersinia intermedia TaxID=631 RepID=UPI0005E20A44|nr:TA system toxin CbtA family protein [Yersinia intermedia]CNH70484.1 Probable toxin YpjF [Yersinia intermedia]
MYSLLQWQLVLSKLFIKYYGMNINDTAFYEIDYARHYWDDCIRPYQAVNEWASKYDLCRLDSSDSPLNEKNESSIK